MVAADVGEELAEVGGLLPGSVPRGGKEIDVGKDKQGMGTGETSSWEGGQDLRANFCADSYFERVKVEPLSRRIPPPLNPRVPWPFPRALLLLPTFAENLP